MNKIARLAPAVALLTGLFAADAALGAIKCWTNREGVRECGNAIPPEYAQQESRTVNEHGVTVDVKQRAKTAEELASESENKQTAEQRAAEEKRQQEARLKADQVLLDTFASEQDILMARDRKVSAVEGTIELTNNSLPKQQQRVDDYRKKIANLERSGKPVPEEMKADMALEQQKLDNKVAFIAAKKAEVDALRAEYEGYLVRYRELMLQRGH